MNEKALGGCRGLLLAEGVVGVAPQKRDAIFREKLKIGAVEEDIVEKWHKKLGMEGYTLLSRSFYAIKTNRRFYCASIR